MAGRGTRLVLGGVLVVLLVVGGVVLLSGIGDGEPSGEPGDSGGSGGSGEPSGPGEPDGVMAALWRTPTVDAGPRDPEGSVEIRRVWLSDGVVVLLTNGGVWGYDPESGEELWRLERPEGGPLAPCATSDGVNGQGVGAVLYRPEPDPEGLSNCTVLVAVDTGSGEAMWRRDLTRAGDVAVGFNDEVPVTVGERTINALPSRLRGPHRFAVADGAERPALELPAGEDCYLPGSRWRIVSQYVIATVDCTGPADEESQLTVFDPETGARLWARPEASGFLQVASPVAGERLTLSSNRVVKVYDDAGETHGEIPLEYVDDDIAAGSDERAAAYETVDFYLPNHVPDALLITRGANTDDDPDIVRGIDVATGEELWQRELPEDRRLFGDRDEAPLVLYEADAEGGQRYHHVAWLDQADGALTVEGLLPRHDGGGLTTLTSTVAWDERAVYLVESRPGDETARLRAARR